MKSFHYFKFVPSDYMMGKIQRCSYQAQAEFVRLCCLYWNSEGLYFLEDAEIECEKIEELFKRKIITKGDGFIVIDFLDIQLEEIKEIRQKRSSAGKEGANAKKKKAKAKQDQASAKQVLSKSKHSIEEDSIEEDSIEEYSSEVSECFDSIVKLFPDNTQPQNGSVDKWKDEIRKLIEIDNYSAQRVKEICNEARKDDFWSKNFLSIMKLRNKDKNGVKYIDIFNEKFQKSNRKRQHSPHDTIWQG